MYSILISGIPICMKMTYVQDRIIILSYSKNVSKITDYLHHTYKLVLVKLMTKIF